MRMGRAAPCEFVKEDKNPTVIANLIEGLLGDRPKLGPAHRRLVLPKRKSGTPPKRCDEFLARRSVSQYARPVHAAVWPGDPSGSARAPSPRGSVASR